jgi:excinuclease ABC subunit C
VREELREQIKGLPRSPGVYSFMDVRGNILYSGKAMSLRGRVGDYIDPGHQSFQIPAMLKRARKLEFTVTATEREALILEANMVRHHKPPFNILLKDDKRFPYLKLTREKYPRVLLVRRIGSDGARYFGPFTAGPIRKTQRLVRRLFRLRPCTRLLPRGCIYGDIGACLAPCRGDCTDGEYDGAVEQAGQFLQGEHRELTSALEERMKELSGEQRYEEAALIRDQLKAVSRLAALQRVDFLDAAGRDAVAVRRLSARRAILLHFTIRGGHLVARKSFTMDVLPKSEPQEILSAFLGQMYGDAAPPGEILLPLMPDDSGVLSDWLGSVRGKKVRLTVPLRGPCRKLMEMVENNLGHLAAQMGAGAGKEDPCRQACSDLMEQLKLDFEPRLIEGYDISTIQGRYPVGSRVSFRDGRPRKEGYRRYRIKTVQGQDDFAMMEEVLGRRFARRKDDPLPDLILIDGGKGQLTAAMKAATAAGVDIPMAALAKREEELFLPGQKTPVVLPLDSPARDMLIRVRDEAHRFAVGYHRKLRARGQTRSELDDIPGVGPGTREALLSRFGSVRKLREASVEELCRVDGIGPKTAAVIHDFLRR